MDTYIKKLLSQLGKRDAIELTWELHDALREKRDRGAKLTPAEQATLHYVIVATGDGEGIEYALRESPESIGITAKFAGERGLKETAKILGNAAQGKPLDGPVKIEAGTPGNMQPIHVPMGEWGATDIALSLIEEDLDGAIIDFVRENAGGFALDAPAEVAAKEKRGDAVAKLASAKSPVAIIDELLAHRKPRLRAQIRDDERRNKPSDWIEVPVKHMSHGRAKPKVLDAMRLRYGDVANDLFDLYARHDGCDLFVVDGKPGFFLTPIADWPEHMAQVMDWAREVTWNDEPDEIPRWLETSIPFGWIEGDSERWILPTEGPLAGSVMLSDSDVIDELPRFDSFGEAIASLVLDVRRIVGCGGYNSYGKNGDFYPEEYLFD